MKKTTLVSTLLLTLVAIPAMAADDGATLYKGKCVACHGADGKKSPKVDLSSAKVQGKSDADLVNYLTTHAVHKSKVADKAQAEAAVKFVRTLKK